MLISPEEIAKATEREKQLENLRKSAIRKDELVKQYIKQGFDLKYLAFKYDYPVERLQAYADKLEKKRNA